MKTKPQYRVAYFLRGEKFQVFNDFAGASAFAEMLLKDDDLLDDPDVSIRRWRE